MERILATHHFGPHVVSVVEHVEDEGLSYSVLVDGLAVGVPAAAPPSFEDVVRGYARWQAGRRG